MDAQGFTFGVTRFNVFRNAAPLYMAGLAFTVQIWRWRQSVDLEGCS